MGAWENKPWAHPLLEGGSTSCFVVSGVSSSNKRKAFSLTNGQSFDRVGVQSQLF
jgi:hypothetical protein